MRGLLLTPQFTPPVTTGIAHPCPIPLMPLCASRAVQFFSELEKYLKEADVNLKDVFAHYDRAGKGYLTAQVRFQPVPCSS